MDTIGYFGVSLGGLLGFLTGGPVGAFLGAGAGYYTARAVLGPSPPVGRGKWTSATSYTDAKGRAWNRDLATEALFKDDPLYKGYSFWSWLASSAVASTNHTWNSKATDFATVGGELDNYPSDPST